MMPWQSCFGGCWLVILWHYTKNGPCSWIGIAYVFENNICYDASYLSRGREMQATPAHHHFELGGFSGNARSAGEWKVDFFFGECGFAR